MPEANFEQFDSNENKKSVDDLIDLRDLYKNKFWEKIFEPEFFEPEFGESKRQPINTEIEAIYAVLCKQKL